MTAGKKIASAAVNNRQQTPIISWIRDKLLAVNRRTELTPPPGHAGPDGKCVYNYPHRYPNTQATRSPDPPALPGGVHHKLADNYYHTRDGRRFIRPPVELYKSDQEGSTGVYADIDRKPVEKAVLGVNKGPKENFGLKAPTPGFGFEWNRSIETEQATQVNDESLAKVQKFDKFLKLH